MIRVLMAEPYNMPREALSIVVVIHGTELVTLATHNYSKY